MEPTINTTTTRQPTVETLHKITVCYDEVTENPTEVLDLALDYLKAKVDEGRRKFYITLKAKGKEEDKDEEESRETSRKKQKTTDPTTTTTTPPTDRPQPAPQNSRIFLTTDLCWPCLVCTKLNLLGEERCGSCAVRIPECWKKIKPPVTEVPLDPPSESDESDACPICTYHMADDDSHIPLTHRRRGRYTNADCKHSVCIPCLFRMEMSSGVLPSGGCVLKCPVCRRDWDAALPFLADRRKRLLNNECLFSHLDPAPFQAVRRAVNSGKATKECAEAFSNSVANLTFFSQLPTVVSIRKVRDGFGMSQNYITKCHRCSVELVRMAVRSEHRRKFQLLPCGHSICVRCVVKEGIYSGDGSTILSCKVSDCNMVDKQFRFSIEPRLNNDLGDEQSDASSSSSSSSLFGDTNSPLLSFFGRPSENPFGVPPQRRNRTSGPLSFGSTLTLFDGVPGIQDLVNVITLARDSLDSASEENTPPPNTAGGSASTTVQVD